jgi:hypothetical protein
MKTIIIYCCITRTNVLNSPNEKLWGLFTYDTVFTVTVTLLIFVIGICIDRLIKYYDKLKKQKESRQYFRHFLDIVIDKTCPQLIKLYNEVYQNNAIDKGIPTAPPKILTSNFIRMKNIQNADWFHSFEDKESLSKIVSNIDFLELMINEIDNFHKRIRSESDDFKKPLQEKVNKYFDTLGKYVEHVRINTPQYPNCTDFRNLVNDSILMFHQQPGIKKQFSEVYKKIIRPIQEVVIDKNIFRVDPIGYEIAELGKDISVQYNYVKLLTIDFRLAYRKYSNLVKEAQDKLTEARNKINWR